MKEGEEGKKVKKVMKGKKVVQQELTPPSS